MKIVFSIAGLDEKYGGPSRSVPSLCAALNRQGASVEIATLHSHRNGAVPFLPDAAPTTFLELRSTPFRQLRWSPEWSRLLAKQLQGAHLLHDTGVWLPTNHTAANMAKRLSLPLIISPRGMLSAWSMQAKNWKKKWAWNLYQRRDLESACLLHATSRQESEEFRALGFKQPIAVIPNGVDLPAAVHNPSSSLFAPCSRTVLFLSRIHPVKGLMNLLQAWALMQSNRRSYPPWRLLIVGPNESGHLEELRAECRRLKLKGSVEFRAETDDAGKWELMGVADLFVLPSQSENFGIVVAEALASGVPVITTRGTPWEELIAHRCGWWVEKNPDALAEALRDAMSRTDEERREMGERGRQLVEKRYAWNGIANQMKSVYEWVLGKGSKPQNII